MVSVVPHLKPSDAIARRATLVPQAFSRYCGYFLIPLAYAALTALMLWPLVTTLATAVADTDGDPLLNAWALRWVQHILVTDPTRFYDGNLFAPAPHSLAFSEALLPQALTAWPLWLLTHDALVTYNLSVLLTFVACATAMYALCRALGANRGASFIAGFLYTFAPFRIDNLSHLQVLSMQGMPLALLAVIYYTRQPSWRRGMLVAFSFAYIALSSVYFLVIFGAGLGVFLLVEAARQRRLLLSRVGVGLAFWLLVAAGGVFLFDLPYLTMRDEQGIVRTLDESYDDAAHRSSYVTVLPGSLFWGDLLRESGVEHAALFPGATLLLLAAVGVVAAWRRPWVLGLLAMGAVGFVLSFGPTWGDKVTGKPLPYRWLYEHVLPFQGLRGPDRFATLVLLALAPLAALGATAVWRRVVAFAAARGVQPTYAAALVVTLALVGIGAADTATRLAPTVPVDRSAATLAPYQWLVGYRDAGVVAEFPVQTGLIRTGFFSTLHWHPVLWGHSGFIPEAHYRLAQRFTGRNDRAPGIDDFDALADMGVRTLVVHRGQYTPDELARIIADFAKAPTRVRLLTRAGEGDIYALTPPTVPPPAVTEVRFAAPEVGPGGTLAGQVTVTNPGGTARMLSTQTKPRLTAEVRDANGTLVLTRPLDVVLPAVVEAGTKAVPLRVAMPEAPGQYTVTITARHFPGWPALAPLSVRVETQVTLPPLTLTGSTVGSAAVFLPGETVAMWVTLKDGTTTVPLRDARARADGTISVDLGTLSPDAARIVAHGKTSDVEIFASP